MTRRRWYLFLNSFIALWLVVGAGVIVTHRFIPGSGWLMVHLVLLGAVTAAILVWSQHFADSLLRKPPPGGRLLHGIRVAGHTVGVVIVAVGVVLGDWVWMLGGGIVVAAMIATHVMVLFVQSRGALPARFGPLVWFYIASGCALLVGIAAGVLMPRVEEPIADRLYAVHLTANLLGWIGLTVVGTLVLLWPTVLRTRVLDTVTRTARRALLSMVAGLLAIGAAVLADLRPGVAVGAALYLLGVVLVGVEGVVLARRARPTSFAAWSLGAAFCWLLFCTAAFSLALVTAPSWPDAADAVSWLIAPFAAGFAVQVLLGALSYLLPVVLARGPEAGKRTSAELDRGGLFRVLATNLGIVVYLLPVPSNVAVTVSLFVFGVFLSFLVLVVRALVASRRGAPDADGQVSDIGEGPVRVVIGAVPTAASAPRPGSVSGTSAAASAYRPFAALAAAVAAVLLAVTVGVALDPAAAGLGRQAASGVVPTGETTTVEVSMANMRFSPSFVEVPVGNELVIVLTNADDQIHDLVLATGATSGRLGPGETATVQVGVVGADIEGWCSIAGHRLMGMVFDVVALGADGDTSGTGTGGTDDGHGENAGHGGHDHGASDGPSAAADIDLMREPEPGFDAYDASLAPAPATRIHRHTFTVSELEAAVAPGITQSLWTFGGTAPGPTLRGTVGDRFEITLVNDGTIGHSIDFHAGSLAPDEPMRTIGPGESLSYVFTATRAGIWMYHCSTMPMSLHIANGMFGAVIIDPPGLGEVDREFVLVQSEYYLGPQGGVSDAARLATQHPDLVVFNGYANQYAYAPLEARVGERVRVWVLDAGPNRPSSFHVVGGQFDTVFFEGDYLLRDGGSTGVGGAQALALQPAQGGFVELVFPEAGHYPFVSHIMSDAEKGASGVFRVTAP